MKILFPTDFSDHAHLAMQSAISIVNQLGAELHILTTYKFQGSAGSADLNRELTVKRLENTMNELLSGIVPLIQVDRMPTTVIVEGDPLDIIIEYALEKEVDLIVMGTQGMNSMSKLVFGSLTKKVCAKSNIPVLAIPKREIKDWNNSQYLLAIDHKDLIYSSGFDVLKEMAKGYQSEVDVIHVHKSNDSKRESYDPFISQFLGDQLGEIFVIEGNDTLLEINKFVRIHNKTLLVMIRRNHSFFDQLIYQRNTGEELILSNTPIMIMPE